MENLLGALTNIPHCVKSVQIRSFFWSVFSRIQTEYREIRSISLYSVRMRENTEYLSVFTPNAGKYGPKKTPYLDTFHAVPVINNLPGIDNHGHMA